jgi:hypothetical protein
MEPIIFGKKKALLVKPSEKNKNRFNEIINNLREFSSIKMWEKNNEKWSHNTLQKLKEIPYLIRPIVEKRNNNGNISNCSNYFFFLTTVKNKKICCYIEKKKPLEESKIYQVKYRFKDELFLGTIFSGTIAMSQEVRNSERVEITKFFSEVFINIKKEVSAPLQKKNWMFIIDDIFSYCKQDISCKLSNRLVKIQDIIGKDWYPDSKLDVCDFDIVFYSNYNNIENFLKNKRKLFPYDLSDHKVHIISTCGIPGIDEYYFSLKNESIPKDVNESITKDVNESIPKDVNESITKDVNESITKDVNESIPKDVNESITKDVNESIPKDVNESIPKDVNESIPKDINESIPKDVNESIPKDVNIKNMYLKKSEYPDVYWVFNTYWGKNGAAYIKTLEESKILKKMFKNIENTSKDYLIFKCEWVEEFEKWKPICL